MFCYKNEDGQAEDSVTRNLSTAKHATPALAGGAREIAKLLMVFFASLAGLAVQKS